MNFFKRQYFSKCLMILFTIPFLFGFSSGTDNLNIITSGNQKYLANTVIVKLRDVPLTSVDGKTELPSSINSYMKRFNLYSATSIFPGKKNDNRFGLNKIVMIKYDSGNDPYFVSSKLKSLPDVEWAEPKYVYELDYNVDDPSYTSQWNLAKINASLAWDVTTGDTSIIIGIVDTGVDWDHPDLAANIWRNWDEIPGNGLDDDNNGYVDDTRGWDFGGLHGDPDNNPMEDRPDHGTHVAGISSAVTNNGTGVASIGFNSKIMAVKTTIDDQRGPNGPYVIFGFEGIRYAVDNGAKVINCSWGGGGYSIFGQETIDYAISKGALVVTAAGNNNSSSPYYPSYYKGVLSVGSTTTSDSKSSFSNYGTDVDVSAPGSGIYSTWMDNTYATISGTSMSSPLTAGLAALVFAQFPNYTPLQVGEQIRVNSDNIDDINPSYVNLLGYGRINAQQTLINTSSVSVRGIDFKFSDNTTKGDDDGIFESGETISLVVSFINYLNPVSNLQITLESKNTNYVSVTQGQFSAGSHDTLQTFDNNGEKFYFTLSNSLPQNTNLKFSLHFSGTGYTDYQWTNTIGNPTFATQSGNNIAMTITSKGTLGFNDYPDNSQGDGFSYLDGNNLLFEGALILGTSGSQISDAARGSNQDFQDEDFSVIQPFILNTPGSIADVEGSSVFNDDNAGSGKIGITAHLNSYTFTSPPHDNHLILDYKFINTSGSEINNFYAGLFFDWDFADAGSDYSKWDASGNFGYAYRQGGSPDSYVGAGLISSLDYNFWPIENDGGDGDFQIYDGFDDSEKWQALSSGLVKTTAGPTDISQVISAGPFTIPANDTLRVAFAIMGGDDLSALTDAVANARTKFQEILVTGVEDNNVTVPTKFSLQQNYPNPFNPTTNIRFAISDFAFVILKIYDVLGNEIATLANEEKPAGTYKVNFDASQFPSGVYFYRLSAGSFVATKKMILLR